MSKYVRGSYDKDEDFKHLEEEIRSIEKKDFEGRSADRVFYVGVRIFSPYNTRGLKSCSAIDSSPSRHHRLRASRR